MISWIEQRRRRARRRRMARALGGCAGMTVLLFAAGTLFPVEHRSVARATLDRPAEAIWRILVDLDGMPLWRSDVTRVERLPDADGRLAWREIGDHGDRVVELTESDPPRRLVTHQLRQGQPALPERTYLLSSTAGGTRVTLVEREEVRNPLARLLARLGARASSADRLLQDLGDRLNRKSAFSHQPSAVRRFAQRDSARSR